MNTELSEEVATNSTTSGAMAATDVQLPMGKTRTWKRVQPTQFARIKNKKPLKEDHDLIVEFTSHLADKYILECVVGDTILEMEV